MRLDCPLLYLTLPVVVVVVDYTWTYSNGSGGYSFSKCCVGKFRYGNYGKDIFDFKFKVKTVPEGARVILVLDVTFESWQELYCSKQFSDGLHLSLINADQRPCSPSPCFYLFLWNDCAWDHPSNDARPLFFGATDISAHRRLHSQCMTMCSFRFMLHLKSSFPKGRNYYMTSSDQFRVLRKSMAMWNTAVEAKHMKLMTTNNPDTRVYNDCDDDDDL